MILTEKVVIKWNKNNRYYYESKGYVFTAYGDECYINATDLVESSKVLIDVKCDMCGKLNTIKFKAYVENEKKNNQYLCISCGKIIRTKYDIQYFDKICKDREYILVSTIFNPKEKIKYICKKHISEGVREINYNNFLNGQGCSSCAREYTGSVNRTPYQNKVDFFEIRGLRLLTKEEEYRNSDTVLEFICERHSDQVQKTTWGNFIATRRTVCKYCNSENISKSKILDFEIIKLEFAERGCTLITTSDEFTGTHDKLKYICNHHPSVISEILWSNFKKGQGCQLCKSDKLKNRTGLNNPNWKGGLSTLREYLRKHLTQWKIDSMKKCNFRCVITNNAFDEIHHVYPFNKILQEVLQETKISLKESIADYCEEELEILRGKCIEIHYRYPLGVCMSIHYHDLFHEMYGYTYDIEDVLKFIVHYSKKNEK